MGNGGLLPLKRESLEQGNDRGTEKGLPGQIFVIST